MKLIKDLIIKKLRSLFGILYYAVPAEVRDNTGNSIYFTLKKEMNQEILDSLYQPIKKSIKFFKAEDIRCYAINLAKDNEALLKKNSEYFYLEFGVHTGGSANFFSKGIDKLYAFDSFEGIPSDWEGRLPKGSLNLNKKLPKLRKNVVPVVGWVEDNIDKFLNKYNPKINFVHFDMDVYDSTKFTLAKIKPYLTKGAIIIFDEYYNYINWKAGEYKAFTEIFEPNEYTYKAFNIKGKQAIIQFN